MNTRAGAHNFRKTNNHQQKHMQILSVESSDKIDVVTCDRQCNA